jgi:CHRD domain
VLRRRRALAGLVAAAALIAALALAAVALAKTTTLHASLSGSNEVPKGSASASGKATIKLDSSKGKVCWTFKSVKGVPGASAAHIHTGKSGKAGAVVVPLGAAYKSSGCQTGVSKSLIKKIVKTPGAYYVNIHNAAHPDGAARGQLKK